MVETLESKIKKLEAKSGPQSEDSDISFTIYLVKTKGNRFLRREWPDGKYSKVDPISLGIEPVQASSKVATALEREPPVVIAVPAKLSDSIDYVESQDDRMNRISALIEKDFGL